MIQNTNRAFDCMKNWELEIVPKLLGLYLKRHNSLKCHQRIRYNCHQKQHQTPGSYSVSFTNTSQNGTEYYWDFDSLGTSYSEDTLFTFPENGPFEVTLQVINVCDTVEITKLVFVTLVGIEELEGIPEIKIGPNPTTNTVHIYSRKEESLYGIFNLTDLQGKILLSVEGETRPEQALILNLESLQTGMYIIHAQTNKGMFSTRILKE